MKLYKVLAILLISLFASIGYADGFVLSSLTEAEKLSKKTKQPILLIFGSDNCGFCKSLMSDISNNKLSPEIDPYIICYINVSKEKKYKNEYNVNMIPDSRVIIDSKEIDKSVGYTKEQYKSWIKNVK